VRAARALAAAPARTAGRPSLPVAGIPVGHAPGTAGVDPRPPDAPPEARPSRAAPIPRATALADFDLVDDPARAHHSGPSLAAAAAPPRSARRLPRPCARPPLRAVETGVAGRVHQRRTPR